MEKVSEKICKYAALGIYVFALVFALVALLWASVALFQEKSLDTLFTFIPPANALGLFFATIAGLLTWKNRQGNWDYFCHFFGYLTLALGFILIGADFFQWNFQLDFSLSKVSYPTALTMIFYGVAIVLPRSRRLVILADAALLFATLIGIGYFMGYLFGAAVFALFAHSTTMTPLGALCWTLLPLAVLLSKPEEGLVQLALSPYLGGKTVRILLPIVFVVPLFLGFIVLKAQLLLRFPTFTGIELLSFANMFFSFLAVWGCAYFIEKSALETKRKGEIVTSQYALLKIIAEGDGRQEGFSRLLKEACKKLSMEVGELWVYDEKEDLLRCVASVHNEISSLKDFDPLETPLTLKPGSGLAGITFRKLSPMWVDNAIESPFIVRREGAQKYGLKGAVGLPLVCAGEGVGVIAAFSSRPISKKLKEESVEISELITIPIAQYIKQQQEKELLIKNERDLRLKSEELFLSNAELEQFATLASHDLLEPVRKNETFVDLILQKASSEIDSETKDYLKRLGDSSVRMRHLIYSLLEYSKAGQKSLNYEAVDLNALLTEIVTELEPELRSHEAKIEADILPPVEGDPHLLKKALKTVLDNSLKFRQPETPLLVRIWGYAENGQVTICIKDNGIGFSTDQAHRIFRPFQRLHSRSEYDGAGIGLTICKKIIERHKGTISAESVPNEGSSFTIELPETKPTEEITK